MWCLQYGRLDATETYVFYFLSRVGEHRVVFRRRGALKPVCVFVCSCVRGRGRRRDGPISAAGRFDDDAGDGDARRREDVDAGETRREVGVVSLSCRCRVVVVVVSRRERIESSTHSFIRDAHSFIVSRTERRVGR